MLSRVVKAAVMAPKVVRNDNRLAEALKENWKYDRDRDWRSDDKRPRKVERDFPFRSSSIHKYCPRMMALLAGHETDLRRDLTLSDAFDFGQGHAYHDVLQQDILPHLGDTFRGWWKKGPGGKKIKKGSALSNPDIGLKHGWISHPGKGYVYEEMTATIDSVRLGGHMDGVFEWEDGLVEGLEAKSIRRTLVDSVNPKVGGRPNPNHVIQAHGYMILFGLDQVRIVYVERGAHGIIVALHEHVIVKDQRIIDGIYETLETCDAAIQKIMDMKDKGQPWELAVPLRLSECGKKSDKRTKYCPARDECFPKKGKK